MAERALVLARQHGDPAVVHLNQIRLATAAFYVGQHAAAEAMLRSTIRAIEAEGDHRYLDFAYQHLGNLNELMLLSALSGAEMAMRDLGIEVEAGSGVAAAQEYYRGTAKPVEIAAPVAKAS